MGFFRNWKRKRQVARQEKKRQHSEQEPSTRSNKQNGTGSGFFRNRNHQREALAVSSHSSSSSTTHTRASKKHNATAQQPSVIISSSGSSQQPDLTTLLSRVAVWLYRLAGGLCLAAYCVTLLRSEPLQALVCGVGCLIFVVVIQVNESNQKGKLKKNAKGLFEAFTDAYIIIPLAITGVCLTLLPPPLLAVFLKTVVQGLTLKNEDKDCSGLCAVLWELERGIEVCAGAYFGLVLVVAVLGLITGKEEA